MSRTPFSWLALGLLAWVLPAVAAAQGRVPVRVDLGTRGFDLEVDEARSLLYVSIPDANAIAFISTQTFTEVRRVVVGARPLGIDVSLDGTRLFAALNGAGAVAVLDLSTLQVSTISVSAVLQDTRAFDVLEASPDRVFVTANPGSTAFLRVGLILLNGATTRTIPVASNTTFSGSPVLGASPDGRSVYVGEPSTSPNDLVRLDNTLPDAPLVVEAPFASVSGTGEIVLRPDGTQLYLATGQVVDPNSLLRIGQVGSDPGIPRFGTGNEVVFMALTGVGPAWLMPRLRTFETRTFSQLQEVILPCMVEGLSDLQDFAVFGGNSSFIVLASGQTSGQVCGVIDASLGEFDRDDDGFVDVLDNCPALANDQLDTDLDQLGDVCDLFPRGGENLGACRAQSTDFALGLFRQAFMIVDLQQQIASLRQAINDDDEDGVQNPVDRCPQTPRGVRADASGCSRVQLCSGIAVPSLLESVACITARFADDSSLASCRVESNGGPNGGPRCVSQ